MCLRVLFDALLLRSLHGHLNINALHDASLRHGKPESVQHTDIEASGSPIVLKKASQVSD
eukprot:5972262-Amphidinium_carterae.1